MDWQTAYPRTAVGVAVEQAAAREYMAKVYRWMFLGLATTGGLALYTAMTPSLMRAVAGLYLPLVIAEFGLVFALSFMARRLSPAVAGLMFLAYSALNGLMLAGLFFVYRLGSIGQAFVLTAAVFGAMSVYGTVTRKDLTSWGSFLFMGLIGVVLASVVGMFWHSAALSFVTSCACVIVFTGLAAYDTQKLRQYYVSATSVGAVASPVIGALTLYLDFINLFLALLRLFGDRRR